MKKLFLLTVSVLTGLAALSQPDPIRWGKISEEELSMEVYPQDSSAEAVVLGDYGQAYYDYSSAENKFRLIFKRLVRIKILNTEGLGWADGSISLYHSGTDEERLEQLKGYTYNLVNGKEEKEKLRNEDIFKEKVNDNRNLVKFTLPGVKVGSVIEYEYTIASDYFFGFVDWRFQRSIPVALSEFRARVPEYYTYKHFMSGFLAPSVSEAKPIQERYNLGGGNIISPLATAYRWVVAHAPALKQEAFLANVDTYASKIDFELQSIQYPNTMVKKFNSSWTNLTKQLLESSSYGDQIDKTRIVNDITVQAMASAPAEQDKVVSIYRYVQQHIRYNGKDRLYPEQALRKVVDQGSGNASEVNLVLLMMLREAGIPAHPVILSTRSYGKVNPVVPLITDFNYTIVKAELANGSVLLDATDKNRPAGMLPYKCLNGEGRLVSLAEDRWVPLLSEEVMEENVKGSLSINETGTAAGELTYQRIGFPALEARKTYLQEGEEAYRKSYTDKHAEWIVSKHDIIAEGVPMHEFKEQLALEIPNLALNAGNMLYLNLFPEGSAIENPFESENRVYPVDFGCPLKQSATYELQLPAGYEVVSLPQRAVLALPNRAGVFRFMVIPAADGKLMVVSKLEIAKPFFLPEEYQALREFFRLIIDKQQEQVVLKKVS